MIRYLEKIMILLITMITVFDLNISNRIKPTTQACQLPSGFKFKQFHRKNIINAMNNEFWSYTDINGFFLEVPDQNYRFDLDGWLASKQYESCLKVWFYTVLNLKLPKRFSLTKELNLYGIILFLVLFDYKLIEIEMSNFETIELDLGLLNISSAIKSNRKDSSYFFMQIFNSRFDFRLDGRPAVSCQQMIEANLTEPKSIFQIEPSLYLVWINPTFVRPLCPLLFRHARLSAFFITGIMDTFYKRNILSFTNDTFEAGYLDSRVKTFELYKCENIELDERLLNPSVFIHIEGFYLKFFFCFLV